MDTVILEQKVQPWSAVWRQVIIVAGFTPMLLALGAGLGFTVVSPLAGAPDITTTKATVGGIYMAVTAVNGVPPWVDMLPSACVRAGRRSLMKSTFGTLLTACWPRPSPL